jgi:hypothetical protein
MLVVGKGKMTRGVGESRKKNGNHHRHRFGAQ